MFQRQYEDLERRIDIESSRSDRVLRSKIKILEEELRAAKRREATISEAQTDVPPRASDRSSAGLRESPSPSARSQRTEDLHSPTRQRPKAALAGSSEGEEQKQVEKAGEDARREAHSAAPISQANRDLEGNDQGEARSQEEARSQDDRLRQVVEVALSKISCFAATPDLPTLFESLGQIQSLLLSGLEPDQPNEAMAAAAAAASSPAACQIEGDGEQGESRFTGSPGVLALEAQVESLNENIKSLRVQLHATASGESEAKRALSEAEESKIALTVELEKLRQSGEERLGSLAAEAQLARDREANATKALRSAEATCKKLSEEIEVLTQAQADLEQRLSRSLEEKAEAEAMKAELKTTKSDLETALRAHEEALEKTAEQEEKIRESESVVVDLELRLTASSKYIDELTSALSMSKNEAQFMRDEQQATRQACEAEILRYQVSQRDLKLKVSELHKHIANMGNKGAALEQQIAAQQAKEQKYASALQKTRSTLASHEGELRKKSLEAAQAGEAAEMYRKAHDEMNKNLQDHVHALGAQQERLLAVLERCNHLEDALRAKSDELHAVLRDSDRKLAQARQTHAAEHLQLQAANDGLVARCEKLDTELRTKDEQWKSLERQLRDAANTSEAQREATLAKCRVLEAECKDKTERVNTLLSTSERNVSEVQERHAAEAKRLSEAHDELDDMCSSLREQLDASVEMEHKWQREATQARSRCESLESLVETRSSELARLQLANEALIDLFREAQRNLQEKEDVAEAEASQASTLRDQNKALSAAVDTHLAQIESLRQDVARLQEESGRSQAAWDARCKEFREQSEVDAARLSRAMDDLSRLQRSFEMSETRAGQLEMEVSAQRQKADQIRTQLEETRPEAVEAARLREELRALGASFNNSQESIQRLEAELKAKSQMNEDLAAELKAVSNEANDVLAIRTRLEKELSAHHQEADDLRRALEDAQSEAAEAARLRDQVAQLDASLEQSQDCIKRLEAERQAKDQSIEDLTVELQTVGREAAEMRSVQTELERDLGARREEVDEIAAKLEVAQAEAAEAARLRDELEALEVSLAESRESVQQLETELQATSRNSEDLTVELQTMGREAADMRSVQTELERDLGARREEVDEIAAKLEVAQAEAAEAARLRDELKAHEACLTESRESVERLESDVQAANQKNDELTTELDLMRREAVEASTLQTELADAQKVLAESRDAATRLEGEVATSHQTIAELKMKLDEARKQAIDSSNAQREEMEKAQEALRESRNRIQSLETFSTSQTEQIKELLKRLAEARVRMDEDSKLREDLRAARLSLQESDSGIDRLQSQVGRLMQETEALRAKLVEAAAKAAREAGRLQEAHDELEATKASLLQSESRVAHLTDEVSGAREKIAALKALEEAFQSAGERAQAEKEALLLQLAQVKESCLQRDAERLEALKKQVVGTVDTIKDCYDMLPQMPGDRSTHPQSLEDPDSRADLDGAVAESERLGSILAASVSQIKEGFAEMLREAATQKQLVEELKERLAESQRRIQAEEGEHEDARRTKHEIAKHLYEAEKRHSIAMHDFTALLDSKDKEISALREELAMADKAMLQSGQPGDPKAHLASRRISDLMRQAHYNK
eukprot:scaffold367_cov254-Pinguiococcus_pyrenoidosus.AAC.1